MPQKHIKRMGRSSLRPRKCDCCNSSNVALVRQSEAYGNDYNDRWPFIWFCSDCRASVGCHPHTEMPLGVMAGKHTRRARYRAHIAFDPMWKNSKWLTRDMAYTWLAFQLGIPSHECHISLFNEERCVEAITICKTVSPKRKQFIKGHLNAHSYKDSGGNRRRH